MRKKIDEQRPEHDRLYERFTLQEILEYKPDPRAYIAGSKGWLRKKAGTILTGPTGMGKSVLVEQIALSIASGKKIFDLIDVPKPRKVLYYHAENDIDTLHTDIPSIIQNCELNEKLIAQNLVIRKIFGISGQAFADYLALDVEHFKPELVIIDHYQAFLAGDINKFDSFVDWIGPVQELMDVADFGLLLVCHTPKRREDDDKDIRELVYNQMGSSAQANWARASAEITPIKNDIRKFRLSFSKGSARTGLRDPDGGVRRILFVEHSPTPDAPYWKVSADQTHLIKTKSLDIMKKLLEEKPDATVRELADLSGFGKSTVSRYLKQLGIEVKDEEWQTPIRKTKVVGSIRPKRSTKKS